MAFRLRLEEMEETLQEFELAWERRYFDGLELLSDPDTAAAGIYLLGYTAEMILKTAYFRFMGEGSAANVKHLIYAANFNAAKKNFKVKLNPPEPENLHSPVFWAELLIDARQTEKREFKKIFLAAFRDCVNGLYDDWWVEMRYRSLRADNQEWRDVLEYVGWLRAHHLELWR